MYTTTFTQEKDKKERNHPNWRQKDTTEAMP